MSKIIIKRSSQFANRFRNIKLYDGRKLLGSIANGATEEFEIEPGKIDLIAKIDWCTSNNLKVKMEEGETKTFILGGRSPFLALFYITFGKNDYLVLKEEP